MKESNDVADCGVNDEDNNHYEDETMTWKVKAVRPTTTAAVRKNAWGEEFVGHITTGGQGPT